MHFTIIKNVYYTFLNLSVNHIYVRIILKRTVQILYEIIISFKKKA